MTTIANAVALFQLTAYWKTPGWNEPIGDWRANGRWIATARITETIGLKLEPKRYEVRVADAVWKSIRVVKFDERGWMKTLKCYGRFYLDLDRLRADADAYVAERQLDVDKLRLKEEARRRRYEESWAPEKGASPTALAAAYAMLGLGGNASLADIDRAYRLAAKLNHPDAGGSHQKMVELNNARDALVSS